MTADMLDDLPAGKAWSIGRREQVTFKADMRVARLSDATIDVLIRNICAGGFGAESQATLFAGDRIAIDLCQGRLVSGRIAWVANGRFGVACDSPLNLEPIHQFALQFEKHPTIQTQPVLTRWLFRNAR